MGLRFVSDGSTVIKSDQKSKKKNEKTKEAQRARAAIFYASVYDPELCWAFVLDLLFFLSLSLFLVVVVAVVVSSSSVFGFVSFHLFSCACFFLGSLRCPPPKWGNAPPPAHARDDFEWCGSLMTTKIGLKWVAFGEPDFTGFPHFDIGGSDRISVWFHWLYMGYTGFYLVLLMFFFCPLFILSVARNKKHQEYLQSTV